MKKNFPTLDLQNYTKQHNIAIDMCAMCIMVERQQNRAIKAIVLSTAYFNILQKWVKDNYGEETAEKEFYLDGIEIRKEKIYTGQTLLIEYHKKAEA